MKKRLAFQMLSPATTLPLIGVALSGFGQEANELEKLKSTIKAMEQTIQKMNRKIAEMEKHKALPPASTNGTVRTSGSGRPARDASRRDAHAQDRGCQVGLGG